MAHVAVRLVVVEPGDVPYGAHDVEHSGARAATQRQR